jgi:uroporphyrinogen-III synthase
MRVVVTRPEPDCSRTVATLRQRGHDAVPMPLTRVVDLPPRGDSVNAVQTGATAVTSANAIRAWQKLGIDTEVSSRPLYAVGERTAHVARDAGFSDVRTGRGDGASLAARIGEDRDSGAIALTMGAPLLYAAGRTRDAHFERALAANNIPVHLIELYDIIQISYSTDFVESLILNRGPLAVLFYSRKAAELFFLALKPENTINLLKECEFFCMSDNVAGAIPARFRDQCAVATHKDENHLLSLLDRGGELS